MDRSKWEYKKIKDVCTSIDDGDWIESQDQSSEGIRLIQTGNVGIGEYLDKADKSKFISEETFEKLNCKEIFAGDCLISRLPDPIGRACILPSMSSRMITAVDCSILRFKDFISPQFFVHYTKSRGYNSDINKYATGATRKRISRKNLEGIIIPIPSIEDQQRIVAELDCLNEMIALKQDQLKEFDKLAQSIFYDMFGDPVTNEKGWDVIELGTRCEVTSFKRVLIEDVVDSGVPFIRGTELMALSKATKGEKIEFSLFITPEHYEQVKAISGVPAVGDLLIPSINSEGNIWILDTNEPRYYKDGRVLWVHVNHDAYTSEALKFIMHILLKKTYSVMATGATFAELKLFVLRELNTILPPLALQQQFAEKIQAIEEQKELVKKSIAETQALLDYTMDKYFGYD